VIGSSQHLSTTVLSVSKRGAITDNIEAKHKQEMFPQKFTDGNMFVWKVHLHN
jgi:hypothetical protein